MKIVYNGLFLTRPRTGSGIYTRNLLPELAKSMRKVEHLVLVPEPVADKPKGVKVQILEPERNLLSRGLTLDRWERVDLPRAAASAGARLLHMPYPTPTPESSVTTVMTVHDMIPWQHRRYRRALRSKLKLRKVLDGIKAADHLLTVSDASRDAIIDVAGINRDRITVTYDGLEARYRKRPPAATIKKTQTRHRLDRSYVLYLGGYDYRKNVRRLVHAFGQSGLAETHDLVLAGALTAPGGALYEDYHRLPILLAQAGVTNRTKVLGFVTEDDKPALVAGADLFVYPSLAEGFGLPILEALGLKVPVAASRIPSTRELFAGAVELFDPESIEEMAAVMRRTATVPSKARAKAGAEAAKRFTWAAAAKRTAEAFTKLVGT